MGRYADDLARMDFESDKLYWKKQLQKAITSNDQDKIRELTEEGKSYGYIDDSN